MENQPLAGTDSCRSTKCPCMVAFALVYITNLFKFFFLIVFFKTIVAELFFIGQEDHLVPSTSRILLDSDLFRAIGRMIGHSFIHGGPLLTGLSRSMFRLMTGEKDELVIVELDDCPDTDIVEIVSLVSATKTLMLE